MEKDPCTHFINCSTRKIFQDSEVSDGIEKLNKKYCEGDYSNCPTYIKLDSTSYLYFRRSLETFKTSKQLSY